jgi:hypothetical protein
VPEFVRQHAGKQNPEPQAAIGPADVRRPNGQPKREGESAGRDPDVS